MEYRLMKERGDHKAYGEAGKRGEHVQLRKPGKRPHGSANRPEEPRDRQRHPDPATCGYYEGGEV